RVMVPLRSTLFPYTTLFRSEVADALVLWRLGVGAGEEEHPVGVLRAGGPDLVAVEHVLDAIANGAGREGGEVGAGPGLGKSLARSEEHTSELQSRFDLVCRL